MYLDEKTKKWEKFGSVPIKDAYFKLIPVSDESKKPESVRCSFCGFPKLRRGGMYVACECDA